MDDVLHAVNRSTCAHPYKVTDLERFVNDIGKMPSKKSACLDADALPKRRHLAPGG